MEFNLINANIVLLADKHNTSIVSKEWLIQNKILNETEKVINFTHLPVVSVVETNNFNLLVDEKNLRLSIKKVDENTLRILPNVVTKYIDKLPEIPYKALGLNYLFTINENQEKLKDFFMINDNKIKSLFPEEFLFGGIIKFKFENFIVTLTLQPNNDEEIQCDFNFHLSSSDKDLIINSLNYYSKTFKKTEDIIRGLIDG